MKDDNLINYYIQKIYLFYNSFRVYLWILGSRYGTENGTADPMRRQRSILHHPQILQILWPFPPKLVMTAEALRVVLHVTFEDCILTSIKVPYK